MLDQQDKSTVRVHSCHPDSGYMLRSKLKNSIKKSFGSACPHCMSSTLKSATGDGEPSP